jgi:hypothetical protein
MQLTKTAPFCSKFILALLIVFSSHTVVFSSCTLNGNLQFTITSSGVKLNWSTIQEINHKLFIIEKLGDNGVFEAIGTIKSQNAINQINNYSFKDGNLNKPSSTYRLLVEDNSGKREVKGQVKVSKTSNSKFRIKASSCRKTDRTFGLNVASSISGTLTFSIFDESGYEVKQENVDLLAGDNVFSIDLKSLNNGTYKLVLALNQELFETQLFKVSKSELTPFHYVIR